MTQQYPYGNANDRYKKKLFVDTGMDFKEVEARIIEPYQSPAPIPKAKEIKIINAPSHIHATGLASYKLVLHLLFEDKQKYSDYLVWAGWTHKFYDEKGHMYLGAVDSIKAQPVEATRRYKVEIQLTLVKKDLYDRKDRFEFQDLQDLDGNEVSLADDIREMANLGLITVMTNDGEPVVYFRPHDLTTRAEFVAFLNRTRRLVERMIRE